MLPIDSQTEAYTEAGDSSMAYMMFMMSFLKSIFEATFVDIIDPSSFMCSSGVLVMVPHVVYIHA